MTDEELQIITDAFEGISDDANSIQPPINQTPPADSLQELDAGGAPTADIAENPAIAGGEAGALSTPPIQQNAADPQVLALIESLQQNNAALYEEIQRGRQTPPLSQSPQQIEPAEELSDEERLIDYRTAKMMQPVMQENAALKAQLAQQQQLMQQLAQAEQARAVQARVEAIKSKYPDFNPDLVGAQLVQLRNNKTVQLMRRGFDEQRAFEQANLIVQETWDHPEGLENLWLIMKAKDPALQKMITPPAANPPKNTPDEHITPSAQSQPQKSIRERLASANRDEQYDAINEAFG
jgi:hypothetical protein